MKMNPSLPLTALEGKLEQITYFNKETLYTIAKLKTGNTDNLVTVVGFMGGVSPGEALRIKGTWETHPKYGQQFRIKSYDVTLPASVEGIGSYLQSGIIKGIGPMMASRMVKRFGADTLNVIENCPEKLLEVEGIGKTKATSISNAWKNHHAIRSLMQFLQEAGVKTSYSSILLKEYGMDALKIIQSNPYCLANDIPGIGFYAADTIALSLGKLENEPERVRACIIHLMQQSTNDGHVFAYMDQLTARCKNLFQIDSETTEEAIEDLSASGDLIIENKAELPDKKAVYLKTLHHAEAGLANRLKAFLSVPVVPQGIDSEQISNEVLKKLAIKLSQEQLNVLEKLFFYRAVIITGGPGTGKTTLIRSINAVFEALGKQISLAAPTGRAARRLAELTHRDAKTIHRLLGYNFKDNLFDKNQDNPLDADAVIIDEASMVDTYLMFHLLNAIPMTSMLIMVGDVFQLPSVGPGNVLDDMIKSGVIPVFYLKKIFRQARESSIVLNAHRVLKGEFPLLKHINEPTDLSEFYFIEQNNPEKVLSTIVELCTRAVPERFGFNPVNEIQVLTPMHKGVVGTINLNQMLQKALNPTPVIINAINNSFKLGDKVMHLKNNYQKEVFNGDIGTIISIDGKKEELSVDFYGRTVSYDFTETGELSLAYAISVHKSQGSEYPAVIIPLMTHHYALLQRNLLYTAITRGEKLVIVIGMKKALDIALKNDKPRRRLSMLADRLSTYRLSDK
ncbi:MAG: ATP-dependent RecD-like DNA helicase [Proteobacteria bacterium]|nr:ATP-dependent RecD-like DNA helicase [Pseudomonadota bacterium]MBU4013726.1 ATP-dependent RecD-like DNA helicase [Pseudomonadota bacterium]MBU4068702.1 ATP-dependent RecD-like DNA helicase [Pseudomonadota bacterium]MBU4101509.1 ATP-dependent RecD-like DNA helicase [Pseudomonadota bacterium]